MPKVTKQTQKQSKTPKGTGDFLEGIMPIGEMEDTGLKILLVGGTGTGKTTLGCTAPKPLLLIRPDSIEEGHKSVKLVKGVEVTPRMTDASQLDLLVDQQKETGQWATMFLDGAHFYQDLCLKKVLGLKEVPAQLNWGIATQSDWGTVASEFKEYMRRFLRLADSGTTIIVSGGERTLEEKGEPPPSDVLIPSHVVAITPSAAGWLNFVMDYIVCTYYRPKIIKKEVSIAGKKQWTTVPGKGVEFCIRTTPNSHHTTKFRVPKGTELPEYIVDPEFDNIITLIEGGKLASNKS